MKEYYSSEGCMPSAKTIYNAFFFKAKEEKFMDKKSQQLLTERLLQHKDKIREKNRLNKIEQEIKETAKTHPRSQTIKSNSIQLGDNYNMYDHQMKYEIKKKAKWYDKVIEESMKEKEVMAQAKPCPGSQKMIKNSNRAGNIHYNLYEKGTKQMKLKKGLNSTNQSQNDLNMDPDSYECTFQPKINKKSKQITAEGKVEDRLTTDARKRLGAKLLREEAKIKESKSNSIPKHGAKSQNYAYNKFCKEYQEALSRLNKTKGDPFTYQELCEIMRRLGFTTKSTPFDKSESPVADVWIIMGAENQEFVNEMSIFNILCIILNFNYPFLYSEEYQASKSKMNSSPELKTDKNTVGMIGKNGVFYLRNESEIQRVHSYFSDFTFNRIHFVNDQAKEKKAKLDVIQEQMGEEIVSFKPKIDQLSKAIEMNKSKNQSRTPRFDILLSKGKEYSDKKSNKLMQSKEKEVQECTFIPNIKKPAQARTKRNNKAEGNTNISIEETKFKLKESLASSNAASQQSKLEQGVKNLKPKINHVIMELDSK